MVLVSRARDYAQVLRDLREREIDRLSGGTNRPVSYRVELEADFRQIARQQSGYSGWTLNRFAENCGLVFFGAVLGAYSYSNENPARGAILGASGALLGVLTRALVESRTIRKTLESREVIS